MTDDLDTIAAIATAPGEAGIAIVRMSGSEALKIADTVFTSHGQPPSNRPGGTFVYGRIALPEVLRPPWLCFFSSDPRTSST